MKREIPFFDITRQNVYLKEKLVAEISTLIDSGKFILGENVKAFEGEMAQYCGKEYAVGVANGSDALFLSLLAYDIKPGDEVITSPFTFYATAGAILRTGAVPVFVDIDDTFNINTDLIEAKITDKTKAIMPVHLFGRMADMEQVYDIANKYGLSVVEDAAQSCGGVNTACLSFFPTKNLGCFGDGGMVVTDDQDVAEKIRLLRVHGAKHKYHHELPGINSRLDEIQAVILRHKLPYLDGWIARRREIAQIYNSVLGLPDIDSVYNQYTIQVNGRDELQTYLKEQGIGSAIYYPVPLHLQKVFKGKEGDFPEAERVCQRVLSLPIYPELTDKEVSHVAQSCSYWCGEMGQKPYKGVA